MCGIGGIFGSAASPDELRGALERMAESMRHRGPDDAAVRLLPELEGGLAVRRLAIVDLAGGGQPIASEDGTIIVVLNGEIYNHRALRRRLESRGHRFRTASDTETLVHLYEEEGRDLVQHLDGMFAFAVVDRRRRRVLLARDGPGMKPLYFTRRVGLAFASEARALFAAGAATPRPNAEAIDVYLAAGFIPAPHTPFEGIEKLPAGCTAVFEGGRLSVERYWRFGFATDEPARPDEDYVDELAERLDAAVATHLAADVPVGCYLSGGWDSSLVATLAARRTGAQLKTFSIVFPDSAEVDESRHSRHMAKVLGTDHHEVEYRPALLFDLLTNLARHLEEPIASVPAGVAYVLASLGGRHVKAVIGGEGSDELFGGYAWFRSPYPYWLRHITPRPVARLGRRWARDIRVRRWLSIAAARDGRAADSEWRRILLPGDKRALLKPHLRSEGPDLEPVRIPDALAATCRTRMQRRLASDIHGRLPDGILLTHDKVAMAHSLEVRMPFLDRRVIDLAARLPTRLTMHRGREKVVVRRLAQRLLPPQIAARRKQGLAYPLANWTSPEVLPRVRELLLDGVDQGPFERPALERLLAAPPPRRPEASALGAIVLLQAWWSEFF